MYVKMEVVLHMLSLGISPALLSMITIYQRTWKAFSVCFLQSPCICHTIQSSPLTKSDRIAIPQSPGSYPPLHVSVREYEAHQRQRLNCSQG
jgi:hypothetical protein